MLDSNTKRRIDTARDILVGKVPDPKSQVEQITIALIYKFMDDMDAESEELGGKRKFFTGDFARYGWSKLMQAGIGGHEMLSLYGEGIAKMPENTGIPPLFRDIFKNAYLPYRDPETLKAFLKIIDEFSYDHSERLGDAFEYLLSVLGSQGDAGQFRTPRHIIDFMVEVIDPKKGETILDPACGTAGFLISAYKHIMRAHDPLALHSSKSGGGADPSDMSDPPDLPASLALVVPKEKIAANGDYNLSGERYRESVATTAHFPYVTLADVCEINSETANPVDLYPCSHFNYIDISCVENESGKFLGANKVATDEAPSRARRAIKQGDVIISTVRPNLKAFAILTDVPDRAIASTGFAVLRAKAGRLLPGFLINALRHEKSVEQMVGMSGKGAYPSINQSDVEKIQIPLPPLEVQKEIVAEIEAEQALVAANRELITRFEQKIQTTLARIWGEDTGAPVRE